MVLDFTYWDEAVKTRDAILELPDSSLVRKEIDDSYNKILANKPSKREQLDFLNHLNSLFLNILVNNIIPKDVKDKTKYHEIVEEAREQLKEKILPLTP